MILSVKAKMNERDNILPPAVALSYPSMMMTPNQIRAARALLGWKQTELADASGVSEISIKNIERGATDARGSTLAKVQTAIEKAGVEIIPADGASIKGGPGVRLKRR